MAPPVTERQVKAIILRELPAIVERDRQVRDLILRLSQEQFADKRETESRFDRVLEELRRDREEQARKWDEHRVEDARKWAEQNAKWAEQNAKWDENQRTINRILDELHALNRRHDSTLGALGARWGLNTEQSFRNALKGLLEESFGVQVVNVVEYDDTGEVFGQPEQVELDVIIRNGVLILGEIKSSLSQSDMYAFDRKTRFYEKRHGQLANRRMVISPMVDARAQLVARQLGIEGAHLAVGGWLGQEQRVEASIDPGQPEMQ